MHVRTQYERYNRNDLPSEICNYLIILGTLASHFPGLPYRDQIPRLNRWMEGQKFNTAGGGSSIPL